MNAREVELIRRRERLLMRAEMQRDELAAVVQRWQTPIRVIDGAVETVRTLRDHPLLWVIPLAVAVAAKPRRVVRWGGRAWTLWKLWQNWRASALARWLRHAA